MDNTSKDPSAAELRLLVDNLPSGIIVIDRRYCYAIVNATYARMMDWPKDELVSRRVADVIGDELFCTFIKPALERVFEGEELRLERPWRLDDYEAWQAGAAVPTIKFHYIPQWDAHDHIVGCIGVIMDATDERHRESELVEQTLRDPLTGALNRRGLERLLESLERRPEAELVAHSLCAVDLDGFKAVNDHYGHAVGDALLVHVANALTGSVRQTDSVVRLGGDEFALLLERCDPGYARKVADAVLGNIREVDVEGMDGSGPDLDASIGITQLWLTEGWERAMERADTACYAAKQRGGGAVWIAADEPACGYGYSGSE